MYKKVSRVLQYVGRDRGMLSRHRPVGGIRFSKLRGLVEIEMSYAFLTLPLLVGCHMTYRLYPFTSCNFHVSNTNITTNFEFDPNIY